MGFWNWLTGEVNHQGTIPNTNPATGSVGENTYNPGDASMVTVDPVDEVAERSLSVFASAWSGWPSEWSTPEWSTFNDKLGSLVDTAWACLDLNARVLASMPVYRTQSGLIVDPASWMTNPDPDVYSSWYEFAHEFWWNYQLGEVFVLPSDWYAATMSVGGVVKLQPSRFHVIPSPMVKVEMDGRRRVYTIGQVDVTSEILHIRYQGTSMDAHGYGPLSIGAPRMVASKVLSDYLTKNVSHGGVPDYILEVERSLKKPQADELLDQWMDSRLRSPDSPAIVSGGTKAVPMQRPTAKDMMFLEVAQFVESRLAILLGVPPYLVGLPSGGDPMTYANQTGLFDFHDRSSLRPKAVAGMQALSNWALPRGQAVELNRDDYTRPTLPERAAAYKDLAEIGAIRPEEVRAMERIQTVHAPLALTGGDMPGGMPNDVVPPAPPLQQPGMMNGGGS